MAICKHNTSKNGFSAAVEYLTMQHDAKGALLHNEEGLPLLREEYLISGIHCLPETFAPLCLQDRIHFGKKANQRAVDTHQYILSFAPSDTEQGLTMTEAHRFGTAFANRNFPGHRVLVCTHPDGGQSSGNIHIHIVISALRFEDRPPDVRFMRLRQNGSVKPSEYKAGYSHQDTAALRKHLLAQVNAYCQSRGYAICPEKAEEKVSQGEYLLKQKGIETRNNQLRRAVSDAAARAHSWDDFTARLNSDYTHVVPAIPPIPFPIRQKLWNEYKEIIKQFWAWEKLRRTLYQTQLTDAFTELKQCVSRHRKAEIRIAIGRLKESQAKLQLYRKLFQTYSKAASISLRSHNLEDAMLCLEQLKELDVRKEGYWKEGFAKGASSFSLLDGPVRSRITWKQLEENDLIMAQKILQSVQEEAEQRKKMASVQTEVPMPIEVKITRGKISFRHPDSKRWVRGKRLGDAYTLRSLGISPPRSRSCTYAKAHAHVR